MSKSKSKSNPKSHLLLWILSSATLASAHLPLALASTRLGMESRAYTGPACNASFQWTDSSVNISPCQLAATVYGACAGPTWTIVPLDSTSHYTTPAGSYVTQCSCSWLAYNLISACTLCQGFQQDILSWNFYATNCSGSESSTYFPTTQTLPDGTAIPYYAVKDPTSWDSQRFNLQQAISIADEGHADIIWSTTHKKSTPIGAIVGGVIGSLAIILLGAGLAFFMYRRRTKNASKPKRIPGSTLIEDDAHNTNGHARTVSDLSQKSTGIGFGYPLLDRSFLTTPSSQVPLSPTTGTMHTHTGSVNSLSFFGSVNNSVAPYTASVAPTSPPPTTLRALSPVPASPPATQAQQNFAGMNREDIIVPFTLAPSPASGGGSSGQDSNGYPTDRKRTDGAIIPVYDSPNSLPTHATPSDPEPAANDNGYGYSFARTTAGRARVNPPVYSAIDEGGPGAGSVMSRGPPAMHSKKGSGDTQFSIETTTSAAGGVAPVIQRHGHGRGGGSVSAIDDVVGNMSVGLSPVVETESSGGTLGTGLSLNFVGGQGFRPVIGNPDP